MWIVRVLCLKQLHSRNAIDNILHCTLNLNMTAFLTVNPLFHSAETHFDSVCQTAINFSFSVTSNPPSPPPPPTTTTTDSIALSVFLFLYLKGWLHHIWCAILLNIMDLHMLSFGTLVPEGPCKKVSSLLRPDTFFLLVLWFDTTHIHAQRHTAHAGAI